MDIKKLISEAQHSYKIFLECCGKIDCSNLHVLKWPDATQSAIDYILAIENNDGNSDNLRKILVKDLSMLIVYPLISIYKACVSRFSDFDDCDKLDLNCNFIDFDNPIDTKLKLIDEINYMFKELSARTNFEYPEIKMAVGK